MIPPNPHRQAPTVHGINSRIVFLTLSDVLCVRCQYIGIHSRNVFTNRSGLILQKKIRKFAEKKQTNRQTNRQTENSKPEATLIPMDRRGERANIILIIYKTASLTNTDSFMDCIPYFPVQFKGWIRKTVNSMKSNQS